MSHWKTVRSEDIDAHVLRLDLEDRVATSRLDGPEREARRDAIQQEFGSRIDALRDSGAKSELQLIYLLRSWIRQSGFSSVMSAEHGLPHEDLGEQKVDIRLEIGSMNLPLQIKTADLGDAYRKEHYEAVNAKASAAVAEQETALVTLHTPLIRDAYEAVREQGGKTGLRRASGLRRKMVEAIASQFPKAEAELIRLLLPEPESAPRSKKELVPKVDQDFVIRNSSIPQLVRLGLLPETVKDAGQVKSAKETLLKHLTVVAKIFPTREAYLSPSEEDIEQLKTALEGR
jgi:hypothetical protein